MKALHKERVLLNLKISKEEVWERGKERRMSVTKLKVKIRFVENFYLNRDCLQMSLLILRKCKQINRLLFSLESRFCYDLKGRIGVN